MATAPGYTCPPSPRLPPRTYAGASPTFETSGRAGLHCPCLSLLNVLFVLLGARPRLQPSRLHHYSPHSQLAHSLLRYAPASRPARPAYLARRARSAVGQRSTRSQDIGRLGHDLGRGGAGPSPRVSSGSSPRKSSTCRVVPSPHLAGFAPRLPTEHRLDSVNTRPTSSRVAS
ncbi:hypothetical protein C8J57DRAFT_149014 [Mycena rebaudengoi]|nr:hypothetical protein C8J57DRAFT_149014 [Mycena rebaudengoi]